MIGAGTAIEIYTQIESIHCSLKLCIISSVSGNIHEKLKKMQKHRENYLFGKIEN